MQKTARLKKIARHLLATTCLTVAAAGLSQATTLNESTDFGGSFGTAFGLPVGTDVVNGTLNNGLVSGPSDITDFFTFTGLLGGGAYSFLATTPNFGPSVTVYNSSNSILNGPLPFFSAESASGSGVIPLDGTLVVLVENNEGTGNYAFSLTAPLASTATPEPSTFVGLGLGLAGGLALKRRALKRRQKA